MCMSVCVRVCIECVSVCDYECVCVCVCVCVYVRAHTCVPSDGAFSLREVAKASRGHGFLTTWWPLGG